MLLAFAAGNGAGAAEAVVRGTGDLGVVIERASGRILAFVFGRDGGLSKVDLLTRKLDKRIIQGGNAIGGAISQDGTLIAVSNYEPGGVKVFSAETLALLADIPAVVDGRPSKVVGLVDLPDQAFAFALYDAGEIWVAELSDPRAPKIRRYPDVGVLPYDGFGVDQGRYYVAGLFGEDGVALLDLWRPDAGVRRILDGYGKGEEPLPVYKMPHLE
ncbi:MAG: protein nirF, partial [Rhodospirillales bacterium]|nr:protein nirF [Rhodospirillales bacterium]